MAVMPLVYPEESCMFVFKLRQYLSIIVFTCRIWAAPPAYSDELWMFVVKLGQDLSYICSLVEFGQCLRRNLKNRGCSWSNWEEAELSLIAFTC